ncbi:hypothetical protein CLPUN_13280 [Clostridium puniceum]|uniref:Replication-associated protein ORF2/G2P domain-containing protein n=1 Tax=Clostridium puniceum TaxID=29367 RepID=A0A1S8TRT2_9CLOT|nr:hypothetical protein [Clostridium puniceum]OOM80480.1 hypothetical protein CLPUN_13280 [Clostridium puniceum]
MKSFIREKKIFCNEYLEVDIYRSTEEQNKKGKRSKKKKVSAPKQKNLNDKNAKRYFVQLGNRNFGREDLHVSFTYSNETLPSSYEEAQKQANNYLRRIDYRRKKEGLSPLKYILVTEYTEDKKTEKPTRIHHHAIISGGLIRDVVEDLWCKRRKKGEKIAEKIGYVNADRLQPNEFGIKDLCKYLVKNPDNKKRWTQSQNLLKPVMRTNDYRYTKTEIKKISRCYEDRQYWEKKYPGWIFTTCKAKNNKLTGWSFYLKFRKRDVKKE